MANTIKVIDLLNKIANGEEPEKIKHNETEYNLNKITGWYQNIDVIGNVSEWFISIYRLYDTVEIIEEQQDIDIQNLHDINIDEVMTLDNDKRIITALANINVLIQAAKQTDRNIKDKE